MAGEETCTSEEKCIKVGGYWYQGKCYKKGAGGPGDPGGPSGEVFVYRGLTWQKNHPHGEVPPKDQAEAEAYCSSLTIGSLGNWRLPTKDELKTLVWCSDGTPTPLVDNHEIGHPKKCGLDSTCPALPKGIHCTDPIHTNHGMFKCPVDGDYFWTSTPSNDPDVPKDYVFLVYFASGYTGILAPNTKAYVRCVLGND